MIYKINISYTISGLGKYEETNINGLEENEYFFLGNNDGYKIKIKKVFSDKIILEFDKHSKLLLPNNSKEIELKIGDELKPFLPINPSPTYKIKVTDIRETQRVYYSWYIKRLRIEKFSLFYIINIDVIKVMEMFYIFQPHIDKTNNYLNTIKNTNN